MQSLSEGANNKKSLTLKYNITDTAFDELRLQEVAEKIVALQSESGASYTCFLTIRRCYVRRMGCSKLTRIPLTRN
jgi:hypothetical protein